MPSSIRGQWELVRNDAVRSDGTYDHDSPVGTKCPEYWTIGERSVVVTTTMMEVRCSSTCDTLRYCYLAPIERESQSMGDNELLINGHNYSFEFDGDTLVMVDDPAKNPQECCPEFVYKWHFIRYSGAIPPDDSPCTFCE